MENNSKKPASTYMERTLKELAESRNHSKVWFVMILVIYFITMFLVVTLSLSRMMITIHGEQMSINVFTGVLSSLSNICMIMLAVFYKDTGFFTALIIVILQYPMMLVNIFVRKSYSSLPGIFGNLFTILTICIIYFTNKKADKYQKKMNEQAVTDSLTGLPNRLAGLGLADDLLNKGVPYAIVSIDLNNFKSINDTMGHDMGDKVLLEVADRWKKLSESDRLKTKVFITRIGADEFSLLIRDHETEEDILNTIVEYKAELERKMTIDDYDFFMTACYGYSVYPADADNVPSLILCADVAMHEVKSKKTSTDILKFKPELFHTEKTMEIERKIRKALENDTVFFYLQPQYGIDHKLRGFETLARMKDEDGSFISPADFIPVAEETGLVDRIDLRVFRKAAESFSKMTEKTDEKIVLSVNVSVRHLMKNNFIEEIRDTIAEFRIPADQLEIEITESVMIDSYETALERLQEVKKLGCRIAIDDFGTGYSSLSYLNSFPADLLKIDKSFIDVMNTSESSKKYVATIVSIGHILKLEVISEGVESEDQLETLRENGCDMIQGFIWGKPLPPEEAEKLLV